MMAKAFSWTVRLYFRLHVNHASMIPSPTVPWMRPPNEHKQDLEVPSSLKGLVEGLQPVLQKAKGIKSLNIELSWRYDV